VLRPVHTRQQSCRKRQQIVTEAIVAENGNYVARNGDFVAENGNKLLPFRAMLPFSATLLPSVDRPLSNNFTACTATL